MCLCCMHGRFGSAGGYLKWMLRVVVTLSATPIRSAEKFFPGTNMDAIYQCIDCPMSVCLSITCSSNCNLLTEQS